MTTKIESPYDFGMSIYYHSVKTATKSVIALNEIIKKIPDFIKETESPRGNIVDEQFVLNSRITTDMLPLKSQIRIVSDNLKGMASRMTGTEAPKMKDNETTIEELVARLEKTIDFVNKFQESDYQESESKIA